MALRTFVKVGNVTNLTDARYCAGMGVDLLGFPAIENTANYMAPKTFQEIRGWITGPQIVAEVYGLTSASQLDAVLENYRPDLIELSLSEWKLLGGHLSIPFILALSSGEEVPHFDTEPDYLLVPERAGHLEKIVPDYNVLVSVSVSYTHLTLPTKRIV